MKRAREDAGLEQENAAHELEIHPMTLSRYERGKRKIPQEILVKMEELYGKPASSNSDQQKADADAPLPGNAGEPVSIDPITFGRLYERLVMTAEMVGLLDNQTAAISKTVHGVGDSLEAMRTTLASLAGGMTTVIARDLPAPPAGRPKLSVEEAEALLDRLNREREARQAQAERDHAPAPATRAAAGA